MPLQIVHSSDIISYMKVKLHKEFCEIEGCPVTERKLLEHHHIRERTDPSTSNNPWNLCCICSNHHSLVDTGRLKIIGVFPSTAKYGRTLIYELDGVSNFPGITEIPAPIPQPRMKIRNSAN